MMDCGGKNGVFAEKYPYHIIEFINVGRKRKIKNIDVVATKWLDYNNLKKKCTVTYPPPPYTNESLEVYNRMLNTISDALEDWISYPVLIKGRAKSLEEANKKCEQLKEKESALTLESDDDDDFNTAEKRATNDIRQAQFQALSASMTAKICNSPNTQVLTESNSQTNKLKKIRLNENQLDKPPVLINKQKFRKSECVDTTNDFVIDKLNTIMVDVQQLKHDSNLIKNEIQQIKLLQQMAASVQQSDFCGSVEQLKEKYLYNIPFTNVNDFQQFDADLKDNDALNKDLNTVLEASMDPSYIISKSIVSMLKKFLTRKLAMEYVAVKKKKNKYTMKNTRLFNKIEVVIKRRRESIGLATSDKEMITALSNVLSNAVSWYKGTKYIDLEAENHPESESLNFPIAGISNSQLEQTPSMTPQIVATGTICNGILKLDNDVSKFSFVDANKLSDSDDTDFGDDYLDQLSKDNN